MLGAHALGNDKVILIFREHLAKRSNLLKRGGAWLCFRHKMHHKRHKTHGFVKARVHIAGRAAIGNRLEQYLYSLMRYTAGVSVHFLQ